MNSNVELYRVLEEVKPHVENSRGDLKEFKGIPEMHELGEGNAVFLRATPPPKRRKLNCIHNSMDDYYHDKFKREKKGPVLTPKRQKLLSHLLDDTDMLPDVRTTPPKPEQTSTQSPPATAPVSPSQSVTAPAQSNARESQASSASSSQSSQEGDSLLSQLPSIPEPISSADPAGDYEFVESENEENENPEDEYQVTQILNHDRAAQAASGATADSDEPRTLFLQDILQGTMEYDPHAIIIENRIGSIITNPPGYFAEHIQSMIEAYRVQEGLESSIAGGQVTTETRTDSPVSESPTPADADADPAIGSEIQPSENPTLFLEDIEAGRVPYDPTATIIENREGSIIRLPPGYYTDLILSRIEAASRARAANEISTGGQDSTQTSSLSTASQSATPLQSESTSQSATVSNVTAPLIESSTQAASAIEASPQVSEQSVHSATAIVATSTPANASPPVRTLWPNSLASRPSPQFVFHDMNGNIPLQPRTVLLQDIIDGLDHYDSQAVLIDWTNQHFVPYPAYCTLPPDVLRALQEAGMTDTWLIGQVFQRDPVTGEADEDFPPTEPVYPTTSEEAEAFRTSQPPVLKLDELTDHIVQYNPQARILENHNGRYHVHEPGSQFPTSTAFELFENNIFDRWVYNRSHCIYPPEPTSPPSPPPASPETTTTTDSPTIIPTVRVEEVSTTFNQADAPPPPPSSEETPVIRYSLYRQQNSLLVTEPARSDDTSDSFPSAPSN